MLLVNYLSTPSFHRDYTYMILYNINYINIFRKYNIHLIYKFHITQNSNACNNNRCSNSPLLWNSITSKCNLSVPISCLVLAYSIDLCIFCVSWISNDDFNLFCLFFLYEHDEYSLATPKPRRTNFDLSQVDYQP